MGIGYGRYPFADGMWEGGHTVVSLDEKEKFCGCGGRGHMEGIMGHRAMRLRFLDMEPEEVFAEARKRATGEARCLDFVKLWHKALAAGTATSIHMDGAGKFFITGFNARFVDLAMLKDYLHQMVKMSPLQSYALEIVEDDRRRASSAPRSPRSRPRKGDNRQSCTSEAAAPHRWQPGQYTVVRPPTTSFFSGFPQSLHSSPARP